MKKRSSKILLRMAPLLAAPLFALTACSAVMNLSFNANWYRNTALKANIGSTFEHLEYEVSFEPSENDGFAVEYTNGVYRTELKNGDVGNGEGYIYTTDLEISVSFLLNGARSETFRDTVHTEAKFRSAADGLRPISSYREVFSHPPLSDEPESLPLSYTEYHYSYAVSYVEREGTTSEATATLTNLSTGVSDRDRHFDLSGKGTFLDNEQILFALRGVDLTLATQFRSINAVSGKVQALEIANRTDLTVNADFTSDGQQITALIPAYSFTLGYRGSNRGRPQTLVYAKTTDPSANEYRNVLLSMEVPILHALGTMRYKLVSAQFAQK